MKPTLQLRQGQQLTLTPQLRMAIRLLQLSSAELDTEINEAIESNPLLERADETQDSLVPLATSDARAAGEEPPVENRSTEDSGETIDYEAQPEADWRDSDGAFSGSTGNRNESDDDENTTAAMPQGLRDHLVWQLQLSHLSARDVAIGETLIEAINDDGYLEGSLEDIQAGIRLHVPANLAEIETMLHLIQHFDPVGVGARTLSECLCVQLSLLARETPGLALARQLVEHHLDALAKHGAVKLAQQINMTATDMDTAVALLKSLDPKPGAGYGSASAEFIVPDAIAYRQNGVWKVGVTGNQPALGINRHYQNLIGKAGREDDSYLRGQLQEARWLIKSLETRADTLLRVARAIVRQQTGFLEHGAHAMRPLTLREVAEELGLHESTISRATTCKYLRTPRGTFEFKYFFSSGITTDEGGGASATAIQAMLRRLIQAEDPRKPLSDARLADILKTEGIPVARRTVAKYREAINIPPSSERQRLG